MMQICMGVVLLTYLSHALCQRPPAQLDDGDVPVPNLYELEHGYGEAGVDPPTRGPGGIRFDRGVGMNGNKPPHQRWPGGVIPYRFINGFKGDKQKVLTAIKEWNSATCITFRTARSGDKHILEIGHGTAGWGKSGCGSAMGMTQGATQLLGLGGPGCFWNQIILHELGHAIGLAHEQQHPERDSGLIIHFENLPQAAHIWYQKFKTNTYNTYGVPYDPYSVMHYGKNNDKGQLVIQTKDPKLQNVIGNPNVITHLSAGDRLTVNRMYSCRARSRSYSRKPNRWVYGGEQLLYVRRYFGSFDKCEQACTFAGICTAYSWHSSGECYLWKGGKVNPSAHDQTWNSGVIKRGGFGL